MNRVPTISAKMSVTEGEINALDKQIKQLEDKRILLNSKYDDLQEQLILAEGEVFADECLEGKHPVVYWCELPQYMRNMFNEFYQEILQGVDEELTEKSAGKYLRQATEKFKKFYHIDRIEYSINNLKQKEQLITD